MSAQPKKRYQDMTTKELEEATREFDEEFVSDKFGPPPPEALARFERIRSRGRPARGAGAKVISVSVEKGLLQRCDELARKLNITRAALIERGLRAALAATGETE